MWVADKITERQRETQRRRESGEHRPTDDAHSSHCTENPQVFLCSADASERPHLAFICSIALGHRQAGWHTCLLMCQLV